MSHEELEALYSSLDHWSAYDVLIAILTLAAGLTLVAGSFVALDANQSGLAALMVIPGVILCLVGLHKEPYSAR